MAKVPIGVKWRIWLILVLSMILGNAVTVLASEDTGKLINLDQAVQLALINDYQIRMDKNALEKANLVIKEKFIQTLPKVTLGAQSRKNLNSERNSQNTSVSVAQTIPGLWQFYGDRVATEKEIASWEQANSQAEYRIQRAEVIYNTTVLYLEAIKAQRWVRYYQEAVKNAKAQADQAMLLLDLGKVTKTEQLTVAHELTKIQYELTQKCQEYQLALKQLGQQLGIADVSTWQLVEEYSEIMLAVDNYSELHKQALSQRLELQQQEIIIKSAKQEVAQAKNQRLPALTLGYQNRNQEESYNLQYDFLNAEIGWTAAWQNSYLDSYEDSDSDDTFGSAKDQVNLVFSWELDFGSAKNLLKQAAYTLENAELAYEQQKQAVIAEVDEAVSLYEMACAAVALNEQAIPLYQKELELQQLKKEMEMVTATDLVTAELNLANAQLVLDDAKCDLRSAAENLRLKLGELY